MILLDTHLVSEPLRPVADARGTGWLDAQALETLFLPAFSGRVLPFDLGCTQAYAGTIAKVRASGLAVASADGYIPAIAVADGLTVASRQTRPIGASGVAVINPWQA